jgi:hypothetical protein
MLELAGFNLHVYPIGTKEQPPLVSCRDIYGNFRGKKDELAAVTSTTGRSSCSTKGEVSGVLRLSGIGCMILFDLGPSSTFRLSDVVNLFGKEVVPTAFSELEMKWPGRMVI